MVYWQDKSHILRINKPLFPFIRVYRNLTEFLSLSVYYIILRIFYALFDMFFSLFILWKKL